jgi:hypothetical protein
MGIYSAPASADMDVRFARKLHHVARHPFGCFLAIFKILMPRFQVF